MINSIFERSLYFLKHRDKIREKTIQYLTDHSEINEQLEKYWDTLRIIEINLKFNSYSEIKKPTMMIFDSISNELRISVMLCLQGFYNQSLRNLRVAYENIFKFVYYNEEEPMFKRRNQELYPENKIPKYEYIEKPAQFRWYINSHPNLKEFEIKYQISNEINEIYSNLSKHIHTVHPDYFSEEISKFSENKLMNCIDYLTKIIKFEIILILLIFPDWLSEEFDKNEVERVLNKKGGFYNSTEVYIMHIAQLQKKINSLLPKSQIDFIKTLKRYDSGFLKKIFRL